MSGFKLKNEKGFFAHPFCTAIISEKNLADLRSLWEQEGVQEKYLPGQRQSIARALEILENLPSCDSRDSNMEEMPRQEINESWQSAYNQNVKSKTFNVKFVVNVSTFKTDNTEVYGSEKVPSPDQLQWDELSALQPFYKDWSVFVRDMAPNLRGLMKSEAKNLEIPSKKLLTRITKLKKELASGAIAVKEENPAQDLVYADAYAIYVGSHGRSGYLDGRGNLAKSIAGARLFESEASAKTTIRSRSLEAVVVQVKAQMMGVCPGQVLNSSMDPMNAALAAIQKKVLIDALNAASDEDLESAMKERAQQPRRRM